MMFWAIGTLLTNSYVVYLKINSLHGIRKKELLSHYEYRKDIAMYWINPELYTEKMKLLPITEFTISRKRKPTNEGSSCSDSISELTSPSRSGKRMALINDASLQLNGSLNCRLDRSRDHLPVVGSEIRMACPLHKWAAHIRTEKRNIGYCSVCNVSLCMECYRLFHIEPDIVSKKEKIGQAMQHNKNKDK